MCKLHKVFAGIKDFPKVIGKSHKLFKVVRSFYELHKSCLANSTNFVKLLANSLNFGKCFESFTNFMKCFLSSTNFVKLFAAAMNF